MALRRRLEMQGETWVSIQLAANARFFEGRDLVHRGFGGAGIYLLGYSAEMLLKSAYFRYTGIKGSAPINPLFGGVQQVANQLIPGVSREAFHSLRFWGLLLRKIRRHENRALPPQIDAPFVSRTRRLYQNWWVSMRYRPDQAQAREVASVLEDVEWLRNNSQALWR